MAAAGVGNQGRSGPAKRPDFSQSCRRKRHQPRAWQQKQPDHVRELAWGASTAPSPLRRPSSSQAQTPPWRNTQEKAPTQPGRRPCKTESAIPMQCTQCVFTNGCRAPYPNEGIGLDVVPGHGPLERVLVPGALVPVIRAVPEHVLHADVAHTTHKSCGSVLAAMAWPLPVFVGAQCRHPVCPLPRPRGGCRG